MKREQLTNVKTGAQTARTAGPWHTKQSVSQMVSQDTTVAHCNGDWWIFADAEDHGDPEATAAFIVQACNAHDSLVAALESALEYFEEREDTDSQGDPARYVANEEMRMAEEIRAALAKAGA